MAILDWSSRYVVAWELDQTLAIPFVLRAVDRVLAENQLEIWKSDKVSQLTNPHYIDRLDPGNSDQRRGVRSSFG